MPTKPRTRPRPRAAGPIAFEPDPLRLLPPVGSPSGPAASHRFRVQRPRDLVNLQVSVYDCELLDTAGVPQLRPTTDKARVEVRLPFQHLGEQSFVDSELSPTPAVARARTAEGSRLVFAFPQDAPPMTYSVEGVLEALSRLPLIVVPVATPRPKGRGLVDRIVLAVLSDRIALFRESAGLVVDTLSAVEKRAYARPSRARDERVGGRRFAGPTNDLRLARQILARESAVDRTNGAVAELSDLLVRPPVLRPVRSRPRKPRSDETAIEAPYRLVLSPSVLGGFAHATAPVEAPGGRVELWHSRLGVRVEGTDPEGNPVVWVDELNTEQRIVRAVWARDLDDDVPGTHAPPPKPFRMSLDGRDREVLVRQSADPQSPTPVAPVSANKLYLSALGAYLNLSAVWPDGKDISPEILSWDHIAPMGRDQFVKVVYPGYLFPFGFRAALVKQTERKVFNPGDGPVALLHTEFFLVVTDPVKSYARHDLPYKEVRIGPLLSPGLRDPNGPGGGGRTTPGQMLFWPTVSSSSAKLEFVLECLDHDGIRTRLRHPLLFVGQQIDEIPLDAPKQDQPSAPGRWTVTTPPPALIRSTWQEDPVIDGLGQRIAFAPSTSPGDTTLQTEALSFDGEPEAGKLRTTTFLASADVVIPAIQAINPPGGAKTSRVEWAPAYKAGGFAADTVVEQFLALPSANKVDFTKGSDKGGGFLAPNLAVQGLSRLRGAIGDPTGYQPGGFDPGAAFGSLLPKLFGVFELTDLLSGLLPVPEFIATALDDVEQLLADLQELKDNADTVLSRLGKDALEAPTQGMRQAADDAKQAISAVLDAAAPGGLVALVDAFVAAVPALVDGNPAPFKAATNAVRTKLAELKAALAGLALPTALRASLERPLDAVLPPLADADALVDKVTSFLKGLKAGLTQKASYTWSTDLTNFPPGPPSGALFVAERAGRDRSKMSMTVEARPSGSQAGAEITAEITDFALNLFPDAPLIALNFDRLAFRAATGRKADVDVVFEGIEFQGVLGFVNTLKELVPFDGFSDPPYLDVDASGLRAGFDLALPNVAVGVFSLENIALHAGVEVPFLGEALTVGFAFCSREKPFRLTVLMIGGGGFVGLTLSPKGLVVLEMSLEACACLSISLGVASGSVSIAVGVYLRLEDEGGSLTGYFRVRGEVDVLGLISASITLELSLTYDFGSGKMIGRASIEIEVEVFLLSFSVTVSCERRLAGSNGDPTYAEILTLDPGTGSAPEWDAYCAAFAAD